MQLKMFMDKKIKILNFLIYMGMQSQIFKMVKNIKYLKVKKFIYI